LLEETGIHEEIGDEGLQPLLLEKNDVRCEIWIGKGCGRDETIERNVFFD
jgi:hypothetical protein